jgi:hypothetical protein
MSQWKDSAASLKSPKLPQTNLTQKQRAWYQIRLASVLSISSIRIMYLLENICIYTYFKKNSCKDVYNNKFPRKSKQSLHATATIIVPYRSIIEFFRLNGCLNNSSKSAWIVPTNNPSDYLKCERFLDVFLWALCRNFITHSQFFLTKFWSSTTNRMVISHFI